MWSRGKQGQCFPVRNNRGGECTAPTEVESAENEINGKQYIWNEENHRWHKIRKN